jgi:hypothetical protein
MSPLSTPPSTPRFKKVKKSSKSYKKVKKSKKAKKSKRKNGKIQLTDLGWWSVCLKCNKQKYVNYPS